MDRNELLKKAYLLLNESTFTEYDGDCDVCGEHYSCRSCGEQNRHKEDCELMALLNVIKSEYPELPQVNVF